jgi:two-component sensor histidine kinase
VVDRAISPHRDPGDDRFEVEGPEFSLPPQAVVALTLVVHELSTNAAKYGALSNIQGHVTIDWTIGDGGITFAWREHGGPAVVPPAREGFGTKVISRAFAPEYQPKVEFDYRPEGLRFTLTFRPICPEKAAAEADGPRSHDAAA